ncbi:unnamed protein product [Ranitomeya imitator]|uniref:C-type lectin domain-containing protein n=1 Tax=Ranitomeya imitator TaxID=111125 RepID=A0ABN9MAL6_9NEOB|nr:unnamed protein product [Ranitomeya imitator]
MESPEGTPQLCGEQQQPLEQPQTGKSQRSSQRRSSGSSRAGGAKAAQRSTKSSGRRNSPAKEDPPITVPFTSRMEQLALESEVQDLRQKGVLIRVPTEERGSKKTVVLLTALISVFIAVVPIWVLVIVVTRGDRGECQTPKTIPVSRDPCEDNWIWYKRKCYYFSRNISDWEKSQSFCAARNASLAIIDWTHELDFIFRFKGSSDHWIGLKRENETQPWVWTNGSNFNDLSNSTGSFLYLSDLLNKAAYWGASHSGRELYSRRPSSSSCHFRTRAHPEVAAASHRRYSALNTALFQTGGSESRSIVLSSPSASVHKTEGVLHNLEEVSARSGYVSRTASFRSKRCWEEGMNSGFSTQSKGQRLTLALSPARCMWYPVSTRTDGTQLPHVCHTDVPRERTDTDNSGTDFSGSQSLAIRAVCWRTAAASPALCATRTNTGSVTNQTLRP